MHRRPPSPVPLLLLLTALRVLFCLLLAPSLPAPPVPLRPSYSFARASKPVPLVFPSPSAASTHYLRLEDARSGLRRRGGGPMNVGLAPSPFRSSRSGCPLRPVANFRIAAPLVGFILSRWVSMVPRWTRARFRAADYARSNERPRRISGYHWLAGNFAGASKECRGIVGEIIGSSEYAFSI